ncbi:MAG: hypothetical protein K2Y22_05090 [Candidatus Obscuribacterales bacterium]|nr:hypothetical protein [Candidatus Obscuribacterales bacterium]
MRPFTGFTMKARNTSRKMRGSYIADFGPALFILVISVFFPLTNMVSMSLRTALVNNAVQQTAAAASRCKTFANSVGSTDLSSQALASSTFSSLASKIGGFSSTNVQTSIIITNIASGTSTVQTTKLAAPADTNVNVYAIRVTATGTVNPLVSCDAGKFGNIPGLTTPFTITSTASSYSECTQGLNQ